MPPVLVTRPPDIAELRAPEGSPLDHYRTLVESWLRSVDEAACENFHRLERLHAASCEIFAPGEELRAQLMYREPVIHEGALDQFDVSAYGCSLGPTIVDAGQIPSRRCNPIIFVRAEGHLVIVQGNHRVYKALHENPAGHPIFALVFESPKAYEAVFDLVVRPIPGNDRWGVNEPALDRCARRAVA